MSMNRKKMQELLQNRGTSLTAAQAALDAGNHALHLSEMEKVTNMTAEVEMLQALISAEEYAPSAPQSMGEHKDEMEARVEALSSGKPFTYNAKAVRAAILGTPMANFTLASGNIVQPEGAQTSIGGGESRMSSIIDQVTVADLTGMGAYSEPYVLTELTANKEKVTTAAGKLRTASDPTFGIAQIKPYEVNVTSYVDRNLSRLSPAAYDAKIFGMAMRALRKAIISLIYNGDGQASPDFFGIKTAKNKDNHAIFHAQDVSEIDTNLLDALVFAYGGDEEMGGNAQLCLNKKDLKQLGLLRGTNEKRRLLNIAPMAGNANCGTITDGGLIVPYCLSSDLTALSETVPGAAPVQTMIYGDPKNFLLGLFGGYTIRLDESYKAGERLFTILGDAMVGGNVTVDKGFVIGTVPIASVE